MSSTIIIKKKNLKKIIVDRKKTINLYYFVQITNIIVKLTVILKDLICKINNNSNKL